MKRKNEMLIGFLIGIVVISTLFIISSVGASSDSLPGIVSTPTTAIGSQGAPSAHNITNVPWHEQKNALACGDGALEIVYDYWGPDIDQKEIADVARSSSDGTWTYDLVRAGQFSNLSAAQGRFYPHAVPTAGYPERSLGYAAFSHSSNAFWLDDLKALIAADIPVIVLMEFDLKKGGGHYRVAIGYDDAKKVIYFSDPWGRNQKHQTDNAGITKWTYNDFQTGWNYAATGEGYPNFGMIILPWKVDVTATRIDDGKSTITATVTYPCPSPFDSTQLLATNCHANIILPSGMTLLSGSRSASLGDMSAGSTAPSAIWTVDGAVSGKLIKVEAEGIVSGHVTEARWHGNSNVYPPYDYTDAIGGDGSVTLRE